VQKGIPACRLKWKLFKF